MIILTTAQLAFRYTFSQLESIEVRNIVVHSLCTLSLRSLELSIEFKDPIGCLTSQRLGSTSHALSTPFNFVLIAPMTGILKIMMPEPLLRLNLPHLYSALRAASGLRGLELDIITVKPVVPITSDLVTIPSLSRGESWGAIPGLATVDRAVSQWRFSVPVNGQPNIHNLTAVVLNCTTVALPPSFWHTLRHENVHLAALALAVPSLTDELRHYLASYSTLETLYLLKFTDRFPAVQLSKLFFEEALSNHKNSLMKLNIFPTYQSHQPEWFVGSKLMGYLNPFGSLTELEVCLGCASSCVLMAGTESAAQRMVRFFSLLDRFLMCPISVLSSKLYLPEPSDISRSSPSPSRSILASTSQISAKLYFSFEGLFPNIEFVTSIA